MEAGKYIMIYEKGRGNATGNLKARLINYSIVDALGSERPQVPVED